MGVDDRGTNWDLKSVVHKLEKQGLVIDEQREAFPKMRFYDIGAIVFHLKAIKWQIQDFSVERYYSELLALHNEIIKRGYLETTNHRFFIVAKKEK